VKTKRSTDTLEPQNFANRTMWTGDNLDVLQGRDRNGVEPWPASRSTFSSAIPSLRPFLS
jgi:hypothetical protein